MPSPNLKHQSLTINPSTIWEHDTLGRNKVADGLPHAPAFKVGLIKTEFRKRMLSEV